MFSILLQKMCHNWALSRNLLFSVQKCAWLHACWMLLSTLLAVGSSCFSGVIISKSIPSLHSILPSLSSLYWQYHVWLYYTVPFMMYVFYHSLALLTLYACNVKKESMVNPILCYPSRVCHWLLTALIRFLPLPSPGTPLLLLSDYEIDLSPDAVSFKYHCTNSGLEMQPIAQYDC